MVQILKAELNYNLKLIIGLFLFLPVTWLLSFNAFDEDLSPNYIMFWLMFIMLQSWNSFRNKEIREFQQATLPLSRSKVALTRVVVVVILASGMNGVYFIVLRLIRPAQVISFSTVMLPFLIMVAMFSVYFMLRDRLLFFLRNNRISKITREKSIMILMLLNLMAVILGFVAFMTRPKAIGSIVEFAIFLNPFSGEFGFEKFFIFSLILAGLTIVTFNYRKSYLE